MASRGGNINLSGGQGGGNNEDLPENTPDSTPKRKRRPTIRSMWHKVDKEVGKFISHRRGQSQSQQEDPVIAESSHEPESSIKPQEVTESHAQSSTTPHDLDTVQAQGKALSTIERTSERLKKGKAIESSDVPAPEEEAEIFLEAEHPLRKWKSETSESSESEENLFQAPSRSMSDPINPGTGRFSSRTDPHYSTDEFRESDEDDTPGYMRLIQRSDSIPIPTSAPKIKQPEFPGSVEQIYQHLLNENDEYAVSVLAELKEFAASYAKSDGIAYGENDIKEFLQVFFQKAQFSRPSLEKGPNKKEVMLWKFTDGEGQVIKFGTYGNGADTRFTFPSKSDQWLAKLPHVDERFETAMNPKRPVKNRFQVVWHDGGIGVDKSNSKIYFNKNFLTKNDEHGFGAVASHENTHMLSPFDMNRPVDIHSRPDWIEKCKMEEGGAVFSEYQSADKVGKVDPERGSALREKALSGGNIPDLELKQLADESKQKGDRLYDNFKRDHPEEIKLGNPRYKDYVVALDELKLQLGEIYSNLRDSFHKKPYHQYWDESWDDKSIQKRYADILQAVENGKGETYEKFGIDVRGSGNNQTFIVWQRDKNRNVTYAEPITAQQLIDDNQDIKEAIRRLKGNIDFPHMIKARLLLRVVESWLKDNEPALHTEFQSKPLDILQYPSSEITNHGKCTEQSLVEMFGMDVQSTNLEHYTDLLTKTAKDRGHEVPTGTAGFYLDVVQNVFLDKGVSLDPLTNEAGRLFGKAAASSLDRAMVKVTPTGEAQRLIELTHGRINFQMDKDNSHWLQIKRNSHGHLLLKGMDDPSQIRLDQKDIEVLKNAGCRFFGLRELSQEEKMVRIYENESGIRVGSGQVAEKGAKLLAEFEQANKKRPEAEKLDMRQFIREKGLKPRYSLGNLSSEKMVASAVHRRGA